MKEKKFFSQVIFYSYRLILCITDKRPKNLLKNAEDRGS